MAEVKFTVIDASARRRCLQPDIAAIAARVASAAAAGSPRLTGRLAAGWRTTPGRDPGTTIITNTVPYARFVEYGTRTRPPVAMLGRALAGGSQ